MHVGVKLKARLLKQSIVLPLGKYVANFSYLNMLIQIHGKHEHGLRMRDLDRYDRQNFEAVERIIQASHLLDSIPDAMGTKMYINAMSSSIYSYLDKEMAPLKRLEEMWFAVFFFRYWKKWLKLHSKEFNLKNNFITSNAFTCIEVNAHSMLMLFLKLRNVDPGTSTSFVPWMLGSQACESTFRTVRSMTGTFSTIINFSILNLLQRLHKLSILQELQSASEREAHGFHFPRQDGIQKVNKEQIPLNNLN